MNAARRSVGTRPRRDWSSGARAVAAQRRVQALTLRQAGFGYRAIAAKLGVSLGQAFADVRHSMATLSQVEQDEARHARQLAMERLEAILAGHYDRAVGGDARAAMVVLRVIDSEVRILGLNAPQRQRPGASLLSEYLQSRYGRSDGA